MQRPRPTRMRPVRRSGSSGRKAHAKPSYARVRGTFRWMEGDEGRRGRVYHEEGRYDPVDEDAESELFPEAFLS